MEIFYTYRASKQLGILPKAIQKRIASKMRFYASQKNPIEFAERLTDRRDGQFRFRVGMYRLIFDVINGKIYILNIGKRDSIYKK